ncbi:MAG TPA: hypothetical protein PLV72_03750 [Candidatus Magasanikbacteria bacterium]|nr:hypothetical protein [Candidatus Magasanikbacteria bacterium]
MSSNLIELKEFFVEGGHTEKSHVLLHITEPTTSEEAARGYFFALAEINRGDKRQIEQLQRVITEFEQEYYSSPQAPNKQIFETILETANRRSHHVLNFPYSTVHCLFGVIHDTELYFAYHGHPRSILYYLENEEIKHAFAIDENEIPADRTQLFSTMIEGAMNPGDFFYISTPETDKHFTIDRVGKILSSRTLKQSSEHIEKVLKDLHGTTSFGGIIFYYPKKSEIKISTGKMPTNLKSDSTESIRNLKRNETAANYVINNSPLESILAKTQSAIANTNRKKTGGANDSSPHSPRHRSASNSTLGIIFTGIGHALVIFFGAIYHAIRTVLKYTGRTLVFLFLLITNKDKKRADVIRTLREDIESQKDRWHKVPITTKLALSIFTLLIIALFVSVAVIRARETRATRTLAAENKYQETIDRKNAAEAALIYGDEARALELFNETQALLEEYTQLSDAKDTSEKKSAIEKEMKDVLNRLRRIYAVEPQIFSDITQKFPDSKADSIIVLDKEIFAYGVDDHRLYRINLNNAEINATEYDPIFKFKSAAVPKEQDIIAFVSGEKNIVFFDKKTNALVSREITFPTSTVSLSDIFIYSRRLYALDTQNSTIWRHNETQTGYDRGSVWNKNSAPDLNQGTSIAVDGDVYISLSNGKILKFASGEAQAFSITGLDPAITGTKKIWTYNGLQNLYILDPAGHRLIMADKTGILRAQFTSELWQNPTSMYIDEPNQTAYIIDNGKIYKIKLTIE